MSAPDELDAWATEVAAQFPPFTPEQAAEAGRIAAEIGARQADADDQAAVA